MTSDAPADRSTVEVIFEQASARRRIESVPLARWSVELGHLYMSDLRAGPRRLRQIFELVAPWARTLLGERPDPRVSTCYLVDDYFTTLASPRQVVPAVLDAAGEHGLAIDYLARESACAQADGVSLAAILAGHLVADPPPGTTGSRPPPQETGWLANGQRSPTAAAAEAMSIPGPWTPPRQNAAARHSVFMDVELWDEHDGVRTWSCAMLAAVWQMARLGLLRDAGRGVVRPEPWDGPWPQDWTDLPPVVQLAERAAPFSAYRTMSILDGQFLETEAAVRTIVDQVAVDPAVRGQVLDRANAEGIQLPDEASRRICYVFV